MKDQPLVPPSPINGPISIRDACKVIGWSDPETKGVTMGMIRKLRRRLRSSERSTGKRLIFGGGGDGYWTTLRSLSTVGLIPEGSSAALVAAEGMADLHQAINELTERMDVVREELIDQRQAIQNLQRRRVE